MDIRRAEAVLTNPGRNYVLVRIETADGLVGWGDATLNGREKAVEAALDHHVCPELLDHDASRIEDAWQHLYRHTYWRGGPVLNSALSGVDMALWDLLGKRAGLPVYELLGGRTREYAPVYQHHGGGPPAEMAEAVQASLDRGIEYLRFGYDYDDEYLGPDTTPDTLADLRELLGPDPGFIVDVHGRATPDVAARLARELEDVGMLFLEDPLPPEYADAFEQVRAASTTPLAMGELFTDPWQMVELIEADLVDFLRVDLAHVGGITPADKLAAVAEHHYARTAFHGPSDLSPVGFAASVHVDLSVPNLGVQELTEHVRDVGPEVGEVFSGGATVVEGEGGVDVPDDPGLGVTVDREAAESFAYERQPLPSPRAPDGSVRNW